MATRASTPAALRRQRLEQIETAYSDIQTQIDRAYQDRWHPRIGKSALRALDREHARQIALLNRDYYRQQALTQAEYARTQLQAARQKKARPPKVSHAKTPSRRVSHAKTPSRRVSHAKKVSRFWQHFARDGRPVPPWEISVGPGLDIDQGETGASIWDEPLFAEGEYSYEDFDTDWGGYESEDTGYPDENT